MAQIWLDMKLPQDKLLQIIVIWYINLVPESYQAICHEVILLIPITFTLLLQPLLQLMAPVIMLPCLKDLLL